MEKVKQDPIRLPKHAANLGVNYDRPKAQWGAHLRYVGSRSDTNFENGKRVHLAAFTLVDARVSFSNLIGDASASLSLTNVFDAAYTEFYGFTTLGRNLNIGLQYAF